MKKKLVLGIVILAIIVLAVVGIIIFKNVTPKKLELTYETNGGVPYRWEYVIDDESVVAFVKSYEVKNENKGGKVGAPIATNYVFKGLKEGTTMITFRYVSITDGTVDKEELIPVRVDKDKNLSLYGYID